MNYILFKIQYKIKIKYEGVKKKKKGIGKVNFFYILDIKF